METCWSLRGQAGRPITLPALPSATAPTTAASASSVSSATTATAAATTIPAATASPTTPAATGFARFGFIHRKGFTVEFLAVHPCNRRHSLRPVRDLNKTEPSRFARIGVSDNFYRIDFSKFFECLPQSFLSRVEGEIPYIDIHENPFSVELGL